MNHSQLIMALDVLCRANIPLMLWGHPGTGKTEGTRQWAKQDDRLLHEESAVNMDPTDVRFPWVKNGRLEFLPPAFIEDLNHGRKSVLFYDDVVQAPPLIMASLFRVALERKFGDHPLPASCYVVLAGNLTTDAAAANQMPTPLRNRLVHLGLYCDVPQGKGLSEIESQKQPGPTMLEDWTKHAVTAGFETEVIAYNRFRAGISLYQFDKTAYAWPSLRSWEFLSKILAVKPPIEVEFELISGTIGVAEATSFAGYLKLYRTMPSLDAILLGPSAAPVPKDPATLYALATALGKKSSKANFDAVLTYANRMPPEFSVLTVVDAVRRDTGLQHTRAFIDWASRNHEVMI